MAGSFHAYTQGKDARITITCENLTLGDFFNAVWEQTRLQAFFNDEQLSSAERISVTFKDEPLDNVLAYLLRNRNLTWYYRNKIFVILPRKEGDALLGEIPKNLTRTVTGIVRDNKGAPVKNIFVAVKHSFKGTRTDENGWFRLKDVKPNACLETRSILYINKEVIAKEDTVYIQVEPFVANLDPITVVGYPKQTLTGNISRVKEDDITVQPVSGPLFALQGRIPGLYITATSGLPGSSLNIRLRGKNSIECRTDPLIIYDGIPFFSEQSNSDAANILGSGVGLGANVAASPLNLVNVHDVASIAVLKDAEATALYGTRGANGVIVISSKNPREEMKSMKVNVYSGISEVGHFVKYLNTQQYLTMRREAIHNDGPKADTANAYDLKWDTTRYTNWQKTLIGGTGRVTNANMEKVGGGKTSSYRLSGLYRRESTVYPGKEFHYTKGSLRAQYNFSSLNKNFNAAVSGNYVADQNRLPSQDLTVFSTLPPITPKIDSNGILNFSNGKFDNPYGYMLQTYKASSYNTRLNGTFNYQATRELSIISTLGYGLFKIHETQINPSRSLYSASGPIAGFTYFADTKFSNLIAELQSLWRKTIAKEQFNILVGTTFQKDGRTASNALGKSYTNDAQLEDRNAAGELFPTTQPPQNYHYISWYARVGYKHNDKYLLNLTINRDKSTRLFHGREYGNFGTLAAGWIFSRENWLVQNPVLSFGKLRGSLGITGNDRWTHNGSKDAFFLPGDTSNNTLLNRNYTWEKIWKAEVGLELGFFNDNLTMSISAYHNRSTNQLLTYQPSILNPEDRKQGNYPAVVENKGLEVEIMSNNIKSDKFTWTTNFNISFLTTVLKSFPFLEMTSYRYYYSIGLPLDLLKGPRTLGVEAQEGIYYFAAKNGTGVIDMEYGKGTGPTLYSGMQNNIRWKNWEIESLLRFVKQNNYSYEYANFSFIPPGAIRNQPTTILDRWQQPGDNASTQQFTTSLSTPAGEAFTYAVKSDKRITDASYIRMQSLSIAWHFPDVWMQRIRIKSSKLYVQGQNLFTITSYPGLDPETAASTEIYPPTRVVTAGLQIIF